MRLCALAAVLLTSSIAAAQPPGQTLSFDLESPPSLTPPTQTVRVSYRSEILVADGLSLATMTLGTALMRDDDFVGFGLSGYALGITRTDGGAMVGIGGAF